QVPGSQIVFDYGNWSKNSADKEIKVESVFGRAHKAYAIRFQPSRSDLVFAPFRVLVVAENNPPEPLALDGFFFLKRNAGNFRVSFSDPLLERIEKVSFINSSGWQLRPFLAARNGG